MLHTKLDLKFTTTTPMDHDDLFWKALLLSSTQT